MAYSPFDELSIEDRILKNRGKIMQDSRFTGIAGVMMVGEWHVSDTVRTAYTNGRDVAYGRGFVAPLSDPRLRFIILHEHFHVLLMQLITCQHIFEEDPETANEAVDYVVNGMLDNIAGSKSDGFIEFIPGGCLNHDFDGMDSLEVYALLKKAKQGQQGQQGQSKGKGTPTPGQQGQGQPQPGQGQPQPYDEHDVTGAAGKPLTPEEKQAVKEQVEVALRQSAQLAGRIGANMDRSILGLLESTIPWEEQLQDFIKIAMAGTDLSTWRRLSRRWISKGIKLPSRYTERMENLLIGGDTSGSIGPAQLKRALTEIKAACDTVKPKRVDMLYWDTHVAAHEIYEDDAVMEIAESTKPKGGGGTRVGCMKDYAQQHSLRPDCIIIFTDGMVERDWGGSDGWGAPVLWCVSTKGVTAPYGKTLYVPA